MPETSSKLSSFNSSNSSSCIIFKVSSGADPENCGGRVTEYH